MHKISVVFFGSDEFSLPVLRVLLLDKRFDVVRIITPFPKCCGRKRVVKKTLIEEFVYEMGLEIYNAESKEEIEEVLTGVCFDFIVVASFGFRLPDSAIKLAKFSALCIHPSILPQFRGACPIQSQILNFVQNIGFSIFLMVGKIDQGKIVYQKKYKVDLENMDYFSLCNYLSIKSAKILPKIILGILAQTIKAKQQVGKVSFCIKIKKSDGEVNFRKNTACEIFAKFRAFAKWPGIFTFDKNGKRIRLVKIRLSEQTEKKGIYIKTKFGFIKIEKLQIEGKKEVNDKDFLNGGGGIDF